MRWEAGEHEWSLLEVFHIEDSVRVGDTSHCGSYFSFVNVIRYVINGNLLPGVDGFALAGLILWSQPGKDHVLVS